MGRNSLLRFLKIFLSGILVLIISYNFYVANNLKYDADGDAASFVNLGVSLAKFHKYGQLTSTEEGGIIHAFKLNKVEIGKFTFSGHSNWRPPIWPILIAGVFLLFGYKLTYILIFKFLLHLLGVFIFFKTLKLLKFKDVLIIIGTFLYGISPAWQLYSRVFLSEPITLFFITLWIYFLIRFQMHKSSLWPQGIIAGVLILCHPYYIFLPISIWFVLFIKKQLKIKNLFFLSVICITVISVWVTRNFIVLETNEIIITTSSGAVMAKGWNQNVVNEHTNTKGDLADEGIVLHEYAYDKKIAYNEVQSMKLYKEASINFIRSNPELILPIIGKKLLSAFNPFPETPKPGILETGRWLFQLLAFLSLIYIVFFSRNKLIQSFAIGLIISTIGICILTYSGFRFRMPQVGLELLFIVIVVDTILKKKAEEKNVSKELKR
jgi:hypothetical protein